MRQAFGDARLLDAGRHWYAPGECWNEVSVLKRGPEARVAGGGPPCARLAWLSRRLPASAPPRRAPALRQQGVEVALRHAAQEMARRAGAVRQLGERQPVRPERQRGEAEIGIDVQQLGPAPQTAGSSPSCCARSRRRQIAETRSLSAPAGSPRPSITPPSRRNGMPARPPSPSTMPSARAGGLGAERGVAQPAFAVPGQPGDAGRAQQAPGGGKRERHGEQGHDAQRVGDRRARARWPTSCSPAGPARACGARRASARSRSGRAAAAPSRPRAGRSAAAHGGNRRCGTARRAGPRGPAPRAPRTAPPATR